jgi:putative ABC transport system substrate-binding protein
MAYGPTFTELNGRVAAFVDRILKGAKPADLPVEQRHEGKANMATSEIPVDSPSSLAGGT